jgi:hypothetical protein
MCPHHPDTALQSICGEDTCPKCSEEWFMVQPVPKKQASWNVEEVERYFASHLTHGEMDKFRAKYKVGW